MKKCEQCDREACARGLCMKCYSRAYMRARRLRDPAAALEYQRAYRAANRDKVNAYRRAYAKHDRAVNPEKYRAAFNDWYARNADRVKSKVLTPEQRKRKAARQQAYREANRDLVNAAGRAWREANADLARERYRVWYAANREYVAAQRRVERVALGAS